MDLTHYQEIISTLNWFDIAILVATVLLALRGFIKGFAVELTGTIIFIALPLVCWKLYQPVSDKLVEHVNLSVAAANLVALLGSMLLLGLVLNGIARMIRRALTEAIKPGLNRFGGVLLGLVKATLLTCVVILLTHASQNPYLYQEVLEDSYIGSQVGKNLPNAYEDLAQKHDFLPALDTLFERDPETNDPRDEDHSQQDR